MKNKFVSTFLDILNELPNLALGLITRESFEYKMMRAGGMNPNKIYQGFNNLRHRQILKKVSTGYVLTTKGKQWALDLKFRRLRLSNNKKWDKKWRIVVFDIPEQFKQARHILRSKLKALGFTMVQRSVFICPFTCESEIAFLVQYLEISPHVDVIVAVSAGSREEEFKKQYNLK